MNSASPARSIAVLPFLNLSPDPENEYFSDGMTEEIINALTKIQGLKVTARTSSFAYKGKNHDVREVGQTLGVSSILEGSVRKFGERLRITVQLIQAEDGFHLWAENYDREMDDIFALQDEISTLVAEKILENFGHLEISDHLVETTTRVPEAYEAYLRGRFHELKWSKDAYQRAIEYYQKSIDLDPTNPKPYYGIAQCYIYLTAWNSMDQATGATLAAEYLRQASGLDASLPEYHHVRASQKILLEWDAEGAYKEFVKLLEINPNNCDALESLAGLYITSGSFDEAHTHIDKALAVNPLSPNHNFMKGNIYYFSGQYTKAISYMDRVLGLDQNWLLAIQVKAACLVLLNRRSELKSFLEPYANLNFASYYRQLYALNCKEEVHLHMDASELDHEFQPWELYFESLSGRYDQAFAKLKWGLDHKKGQYFCFRYDPFLKGLREQDEYQTFEQNYPIKLPSFSASHTKEAIAPALISDPDEKEQCLKSIMRAFEEEQLYLQQELSLKSLAQHLSISTNKLSWLINDSIGKNFNEYVNTYRLETFKSKAVDPANKHITILGLAYESGFNSKTVFNEFFKKSTGMTPRAWLKSREV